MSTTKKAAKAAPAKKVAEAKPAAKPVIDAKLELVDKEDGVKAMLAVQKGVSTALVTTSSLTSITLDKIGKKFTADEMGLSVKDGAKPTGEDYHQLIAYLGTMLDGATKAEGALKFAIGDAMVLANKAGDNIAAQSLAKGKAEHTARQYERVCEFLSHDERRKGLPFSHHMAVMDYSKKTGKDGKTLTKGQLLKALDWAIKGEKIVSATSPDGKKMDAWNPKTRNELRDHLNHMLGLDEEEDGDEGEDGKEDKAEKKSKGFLYTDVEEGEAFNYPTLSLKALDSRNFLIYDKDKDEMVDGDGRHSIKDLPEEYADEVEKPKTKAKKAKAHPEPKGDADEDDLP